MLREIFRKIGVLAFLAVIVFPFGEIPRFNTLDFKNFDCAARHDYSLEIKDSYSGIGGGIIAETCITDDLYRLKAETIPEEFKKQSK